MRKYFYIFIAIFLLVGVIGSLALSYTDTTNDNVDLAIKDPTEDPDCYLLFSLRI